jgi:hypothetical protein
MLLVATAFMAVMMVASAAPVMANNLFNNDNNLFGHHNHGFFNRFDDENLDTIRVGDLRCLVEDRDDVKFCVNKDTGDIFRV